MQMENYFGWVATCYPFIAAEIIDKRNPPEFFKFNSVWKPSDIEILTNEERECLRIVRLNMNSSWFLVGATKSVIRFFLFLFEWLPDCFSQFSIYICPIINLIERMLL
ncbi:hypothetical protein Bca101_057461 [Brassica carinata]